MQTILRHVPTAARIILGLLFLVFGLNGFLGFIPMPESPETAGAFLGALAGTGYMFPLIKGTEVLVGVLLLTNRFVPLALTLLAPVIVNIVAFHAFLDPASIGMPVALLGAHLYLAWAYRKSFAAVLAAKVEPTPPQLARSRQPASVRAARSG